MAIILVGQSIAQLVFLILKVDLGFPLPWKLVFMPIYSVSFVLITQQLCDLRHRRWRDTATSADDNELRNICYEILLLTIFGVTGFLLAGILDSN